MEHMGATLIAAACIAAACVAAAEPRLLGRAWPGTVISAAAGIGLGYVVVHLLPEIAAGAETIRMRFDGQLPYAEIHAYLLVLVGIIGTLALRAYEKGLHGMAPHPRVRIIQPALSALIVGYLLAVRDSTEIGPIVIFAVAIGLHVAINAHTLATKLDSPQAGIVLAGAIAAGYLVGVAYEAPPVVVAGFIALLAGGVMTRVIHEVLDEERHFVALCVGAAVETVLLVAIA